MRIVIELKRDAVPQVVLNKLYKLTPMQSSFGIINHRDRRRAAEGFESQADSRSVRRFSPRSRSPPHRIRARKGAARRAHILEGLNKAIDALDYIIPLIRNSRSVDEAKAWLTGNFATLHEVKNVARRSGRQNARRVFEGSGKSRRRVCGFPIFRRRRFSICSFAACRLSNVRKSLTNSKRFLKFISELEAILANEQLLRQVIIDELQEVKKNFGDARKTEIVDAGIELTIEDLIPDEEVAITVTNAGYIKRTPVSAYSKQGRGGKGRLGAKAKNEDFVEHLFIASTHAYLMIFTDDGQVFKMKVHEIPEADTVGARQSGCQSRSAFIGKKTRGGDAGPRFHGRNLSDDGDETGRD